MIYELPVFLENICNRAQSLTLHAGARHANLQIL